MMNNEILCTVTIAIDAVHTSCTNPPEIIIDAILGIIDVTKVTFTFTFTHFHHPPEQQQGGVKQPPSSHHLCIRLERCALAHISISCRLFLSANKDGVLLNALTKPPSNFRTDTTPHIDGVDPTPPSRSSARATFPPAKPPVHDTPCSIVIY